MHSSNSHRFLVSLIILLPQLLLGQNSLPNPGDTTVTVIPFQLNAHNNIVIRGIMNQVDTVDLMLHTGVNSISLIREKTARLSSIQFNRADSVKTWGGTESSAFSEDNFLRIANLGWSGLTVWESENSGPMTDGKFGLNLFENKAIEINYDQKKILIYHSLPAKAKVYERVKIHRQNDLLFIEGTVKTSTLQQTKKFLIHSGYGGSVLLDDKFVAESHIGEELEVVRESELKDSYGNILKTKKAILDEFMVGNQSFREIPVGFFEGTIGRQKISVLGSDILRRFNLIIDQKRTYIYLKINGLSTIPYSQI